MTRIASMLTLQKAGCLHDRPNLLRLSVLDSHAPSTLRLCMHRACAVGAPRTVQRRTVIPSASAAPSNPDDQFIVPAGARPAKPVRAASSTRASPAVSIDASTGIATLVLLNAALFAMAVYGRNAALAGMAIAVSKPVWWQFVSSVFVHVNLAHLSRDMFLVYFFGQIIYKELQSVGVWFTYILCGLAANLSAWWLLPASVAKGQALFGIGATGGAMGVVLAAIAITARPTVGWLVGAALAVQFVFTLVLSAPVPGYSVGLAQNLVSSVRLPWGQAISSGAAAVKQQSLKSVFTDPALAWLWGVFIGAAIVVLMAKFPDEAPAG